jgi:hypothetical protein
VRAILHSWSRRNQALTLKQRREIHWDWLTQVVGMIAATLTGAEQPTPFAWRLWHEF